MSIRLVLVHSPLVGPATWSRVAPMLAKRGYDVRIADLGDTLAHGPPFSRRQVDVIARCAAGEPAILIGHSGAGALLAPAGLAAGGALGYVFVDAGLPNPGRSHMSTMPPNLADQLRQMADRDGWLPPWPQWWGEDGLAELIADSGIRRRFAAECPKLPLAMFDELMPEGRDAPGAYLQLSEAYDKPAAQASERGWPLIKLASHHLVPLTDPATVAEPMLELLSQLQ
ncbi:MAG TPA: alpha/beta fold hydrolase [Streptosporangiaceae bacterium]|nr:alpha/beta fold hydrolase [Streptosporangiaceae bacterium]